MINVSVKQEIADAVQPELNGLFGRFQINSVMLSLRAVQQTGIVPRDLQTDFDNVDEFVDFGPCINDDLDAGVNEKTFGVDDRLVATANFRFYIPFAKAPRALVEKMAAGDGFQFVTADRFGGWASAVFRQTGGSKLVFYVFRKNGSDVFSVVVTAVRKDIAIRFI